ncbi:BMP family ABC transporter substrate-binding protein [Chromobacterium vaccinii]|uniref:BMP family ABC transporter substrate-binding protein n=4 Tax=Chromobacteriaceae TaxID=1499392 RepID=A0ABV0FHK2_9NEIS|nr:MULTISPECIES: BMP family ABC transporter substrate-binding protein [Chromobacteriaceae]ERE07250.1 membrane protein [Pseudogulbenkiania ferrooxidans EGD-HP2]MBX9295607.1 BMP family ABC transporter substrate-binding protein [Chromobacterium vaccinii]MBX9346760.1 BMP family ABC transporter substrate-binding protein [Chromobacterium vaccinii]MBX9359197.1 BMP family ABC transporter substrate-binding protein [Chromobacterium vaccinii]MCD4485136.1 BMP family ABC transporter substrate-binding prote
MTIQLKRISFAVAAAVLSAAACAKDFTPAVIYDSAGKFDKSFSEAAYNGAERFKKDFKVNYREGQISSDAQKEQLLRKMASRDTDIVVAVGFNFSQAVETVAKEFPKVKFALIDAVAKGPNVQSIVFKEQEGSFLVGMAAALKSKTGKVGYIGGMDIPMIRAFGCGYAQGAKYANKNVTVLQNMTGTTPQAFNDPARGTELAKSQFDRGADVIFVAAGGTGMGVLQAAKNAGKFSIGVDSNQNYLFPGSVLTSMVKKVDVAVYNTFKEAKDGSWKSGVKVLGLKEQAVDWALDKNNRPQITPDMEKKIAAAKAEIISGKIKVVDYRANNSCPAQ